MERTGVLLILSRWLWILAILRGDTDTETAATR
jgi:hypothetical protein